MRSRIRFVVLCCGFVSLWRILPSTASTVTTNSTEQPVDEHGFEVMIAKLNFLQYKLHAMELSLKEREEQSAEKLAHLQDSFDGLQWAITRHDRDAAHNLTALQEQSRRILAQQTACANHEQMRKEISQLVPKEGFVKSAQLLVVMEGFQRKASFRSCKEAPANESGVVSIQLSDKEEPFEAYCEQKAFGGGWLVIQYRFDGTLDFYRNWTEYRNGFGSIDHEFWIGLERLHQLTSRRPHELIVELKDFEGNYRYAHYEEFEIGNETEKYLLEKLGTYNGTAGDSLVYHKGMKFSTKDQDNEDSESNCAIAYEGAWWYRSCHDSNLNGRYLNKDDAKSMCWYQYKYNNQGYAYSRMMVREV